MNYNYNETNIMTGYIKELLKDFNLPVYTVYREDKKLHAGNIVGNKNYSKIYIDRDKIVQYNPITGNLDYLSDFSYNVKSSYTKNLIINSSVYDSYTHNYLGDYLRFLRDYKYINLMPLYNCFSNEIPVGLNYTLNIENGTKNYLYSIDTSDTKYNYYIIPAKFDEQYTININSLVPYEISCIIYTGDKVLDISKELSKITYKKINITGKKYSYLYSTTIDEDKFSISEYKTNYWKYEKDLKLLLKLPKVITSSITILEGNYISSNNISGNTLLNKLYIDDEVTKIDAISKLSLLNNIGETSHPFADRLIEYLLGNTISNLESIPNNIANVQDLLLKNLMFEEDIEGSMVEKPLTFKGFNDTWDDNFIKINILRKLNEVCDYNNAKKSYYTILNYNGYAGKYIKALDKYDYIRPIDTYYDLLGYVDKDTESNLNIKTVKRLEKPKEI